MIEKTVLEKEKVVKMAKKHYNSFNKNQKKTLLMTILSLQDQEIQQQKEVQNKKKADKIANYSNKAWIITLSNEVKHLKNEVDQLKNELKEKQFNTPMPVVLKPPQQIINIQNANMNFSGPPKRMNIQQATFNIEQEKAKPIYKIVVEEMKKVFKPSDSSDLKPSEIFDVNNFNDLSIKNEELMSVIANDSQPFANINQIEVK